MTGFTKTGADDRLIAVGRDSGRAQHGQVSPEHERHRAGRHVGGDGFRKLRQQRIAAPVVQARLRHASAKTTLDIYRHLWPGSDESTRAAVDLGVSAKFQDRADSAWTEQLP